MSVIARRVVSHCRCFGSLRLLNIGVPLATGRALAEPLGRLVAAILAEESGLVNLLGHDGDNG